MNSNTGKLKIVRTLRPFLDRTMEGVTGSYISYESDGLEITGWFYQPVTEPTHDLSHPLDSPAPKGGAIVVGHGGVGGIPFHYDRALRRLARAGWTIIVPSYRGEDGSGGEIEFADGEVNDTQKAVEIVQSMPNVDPDHTWLMGSSHGAMVSLILVGSTLSSIPVAGIIACAGVYDVESWAEWLKKQKHSLLSDPEVQKLLLRDPDGMSRRSALSWAAGINCPVMLLHGDNDEMVPVEQTERMASALEGYGNGNVATRIEPGAEHEFIWAPDRPGSVETWDAIIKFMKY